MWNYYSYYPHGKKSTFSLNGRLNEIFAHANVHAHVNNYSVHKGFGDPGKATADTYQDRAIKEGQAVRQLPHASHAASPYLEMVWNPPGVPAGVTRVIINRHNADEIYFTDDHYIVYWQVYGGESKKITFPA